MTRALELVVIPLLFAFLGYLLDNRFDTGPLLAVAGGIFGVIGCAIRAFYAYRYKMTQVEKDMPWNR